ncbi:MAG: hypothetical protein MJ061_04095 [Mailhella sp.]|nr:hypothetical protein [Mailhella sp.]
MNGFGIKALKKGVSSAAAACAAVSLLCGFMPSEKDMAGLSAEQKAFVTASDWGRIAGDVVATVRTGVKNNAGRAVVIAGCLYEEMPEPKWLSAASSREYRMRRMLANAIIAKAMDDQVRASTGGKSAIGNEFAGLMDGIRGKVMESLQAGRDQAAAIEDIVSKHLLEAMRAPAK